MLPLQSWLSLSILLHTHFHAMLQRSLADKPSTLGKFPLTFWNVSMHGLIDNLTTAITKLKWRPTATQWVSYYDEHTYAQDAFDHKQAVVADFLGEVRPCVVWDLGANTGIFSRIAARQGAYTIAFDIDVGAVERNYLQCVAQREINILPLVMDLTNPSPPIGWHNHERLALLDRRPAETVLALALIHHLAISNNLPFENIARFFENICRWLIIEFIPKEDSQVHKLLLTREDIFPDYDERSFESEFEKFFIIEHSVKIKHSSRTLYLMKRRG
jgi:hypothetical protein